MMGIGFFGHSRWWFRKLQMFFVLFCMTGMLALFPLSYAHAICPPCTTLANQADCQATVQLLSGYHKTNRQLITEHIESEFGQHRDWLVSTFFTENILPAMMQMTEQLSAVAMQQVAIVGQFFDAKQQLETQRLYQELQNQAHKDYQPSEDFCWFGTNVRSLAHSEAVAGYNTKFLNTALMKRQLATTATGGADTGDNDKLVRWQQFTQTYCDPQDNNKLEGGDKTGLAVACRNDGGEADGPSERINIDIDYTRLIEEPRTLNVGYFNEGGSTVTSDPTEDEEDVLALAKNLYGHEALTRDINDVYLKEERYQQLYLALRAVAAKRSVAQNSFSAIVGMKSSGTSDLVKAGNEPKTREFLGAVMTELGVPEEQVFELIGKNPSYYAQLEILAKKIYQNPDFYANLYDKPANVKRKAVALKAIELMVDRAIYESQLRQEMAMSVLLSSKMKPYFDDVNKQLLSAGN